MRWDRRVESKEAEKRGARACVWKQKGTKRAKKVTKWNMPRTCPDPMIPSQLETCTNYMPWQIGAGERAPGISSHNTTHTRKNRTLPPHRAGHTPISSESDPCSCVPVPCSMCFIYGSIGRRECHMANWSQTHQNGLPAFRLIRL